MVKNFMRWWRSSSEENIKFLLLYVLLSFVLFSGTLVNGVFLPKLGDPLCQNYPFKHLYASAIKSFEFPFWDPYEFAGMPLLGNLQVGVLYPVNLVLYFLFPPTHAYNISYSLHFALGGFFTFIYMRLIGVSRLPAFAAGMVFGFSGFIRSHADHIMIAAASVYLPLVMYFYEKLRRTLDIRYSLLIALTVAVQMFAGNFQICVYSYMVVLMFVLFQVFGMKRGERTRFIVLGLLGLGLGIVIFLPQLVSTLELSRVSFMRMKKVYMGYKYFSGYHFYLAELPSLMFPSFFRGWGPVDHTPALLTGSVILFALVAFIRGARGDRNVLFWGIVAFISLALAMGDDTPLNRILYQVPVYNQFRVVGRHLLEFTFAVSVLLGLGVQSILEGGDRKKRFLNAFIVSASAVIVLAVAAVYLLPQSSLDHLVDYMRQKRFQNPARLEDALDIRNRFLYTPLIMLAVYMAWSLLYRRFNARVLSYVFLCLLMYEISGGFIGYARGSVGSPWVSDANNLCLDEQYGEYVSGRTDEHFRVVNVFPPEEICTRRYNALAQLTCKVGALNANNPLAMDKYSNLLDLGLSGYYSLSWEHLIRNNMMLSMLGGKYITVSKKMEVNPGDVRFGGAAGTPVVLDISPGEWITRAGASKEGDSYVLGGKGDSGEIINNISLDKGTYEFCLSAKAEKKDKSLTVYLYEPPDYGKLEALFLHADYMGPEYGEFCQLVHLKSRRKPYLAGVATYSRAMATSSRRPVYVRDISIKKILNYFPPRLNEPAPGEAVYQKLSETGDAVVYLNTNAMQRAWAVSTLVPVKDFFEARRKLNALEVNVSREAMVYSDDLEDIGQRVFSDGDVTIDEYGLNKVGLTFRGRGRGFVVLSDQHYPGWKAFVDGEKTKIYEVNGVLRGVVVPAGEHSIVFRYRPGKILFFMGLSLFLVTAIAVYLMKRKA